MADRIVIRCDGGDVVGAGHVSRCLPIARALVARGAEVRFAGAFDGVAAWLLTRESVVIEPLVGGPCGIDPGEWTGAVVDLYLAESSPVCDLARALPVATIGESMRCPGAGLWIDFHAGSTPERSEQRLGGPEFAPIDPRFVSARRERTGVQRILVLAGASAKFGEIPSRLADAAARAFPEAEVLAPAPVADAASMRVSPITPPFDLASLTPTIDLAVVAAGMTTYELASAGIPLVAVALIENQRVVVDGCALTGFALPVDGIGRDALPDVVRALNRMKDPKLRADLSSRSMAAFDGQGADRIADSLLAAWVPGS